MRTNEAKKDELPDDEEEFEVDVASDTNNEVSSKKGPIKSEKNSHTAIDTMAAEKKKLEDENKLLKEKLERQRLENQANLQNQRKQLSREFDMINWSNSVRIYNKILAITDVYEKAVTMNQNPAQLREGFQKMFDQLNHLLESEGLKRLEFKGKAFDAVKNEVIMIVENKDLPDGTVIDEIQTCYTHKDGRLVRTAKVVVSKIPTETKKKNEPGDEEEEEEEEEPEEAGDKEKTS